MNPSHCLSTFFSKVHYCFRSEDACSIQGDLKHDTCHNCAERALSRIMRLSSAGESCVAVHVVCGESNIVRILIEIETNSFPIPLLCEGDRLLCALVHHFFVLLDCIRPHARAIHLLNSWVIPIGNSAVCAGYRKFSTSPTTFLVWFCLLESPIRMPLLTGWLTNGVQLPIDLAMVGGNVSMASRSGSTMTLHARTCWPLGRLPPAKA